MSDLVERLKSASGGEAVWRVMTPDGKAYVLELSFSDSAMPASEATTWLKEQHAKGNYAGYYVERTTRYDAKDRLMQEAAYEIARLRVRVADLVRKIDESVDGAG